MRLKIDLPRKGGVTVKEGGMKMKRIRNETYKIGGMGSIVKVRGWRIGEYFTGEKGRQRED